MSAMSSRPRIATFELPGPCKCKEGFARSERTERSGAHFISAQRSLRGGKGEEVKKGESCRLTLLDLASRAITNAFARVLSHRGGDRGGKEFKGIARKNVFNV